MNNARTHTHTHTLREQQFDDSQEVGGLAVLLPARCAKHGTLDTQSVLLQTPSCAAFYLWLQVCTPTHLHTPAHPYVHLQARRYTFRLLFTPMPSLTAGQTRKVNVRLRSCTACRAGRAQMFQDQIEILKPELLINISNLKIAIYRGAVMVGVA